MSDSMLAASASMSDTLFACATCMGDAGSLINQAAGYAIAFMLVMLAIVLGSLIKFMKGNLSRCNEVLPSDTNPGRRGSWISFEHLDLSR